MIIFDEVAHTYTDDRTGEQSPSVNHIINTVYGSGLEYVKRSILEERANYGKGVHTEIDRIIRGFLSLDKSQYPETKAFFALADMLNLPLDSITTTSEGIIYVPGMFAGTADLFCNNRLWDYKTNRNKPTKKTIAHWQKQLSFYYYGLKKLGHEPESMAIIHLCNLEAKTYPLEYLGDKFVEDTVKAYKEGRKIEEEKPQALAIINKRAITKLEKTLQKIATLEQEIQPIREKIKDEMEKRSITSIKIGKVGITYVAPVKRKIFDTSRFKKENEVLYNNYLKESEAKASIRIKLEE